MAIEWLPFEPWHLEAFTLQLAQAGEVGMGLKNPVVAGELKRCGVALTGIVREPGGFRFLGAGGVVNQWRGRAIAWALVGESIAAREWVAITRRVEDVLEGAHRAGVWRIEAQADAGYPQAMRWLELMGFTREAPMEAYSPAGRDCWLYKRVRRDVLEQRGAELCG